MQLKLLENSRYMRCEIVVCHPTPSSHICSLILLIFRFFMVQSSSLLVYYIYVRQIISRLFLVSREIYTSVGGRGTMFLGMMQCVRIHMIHVG
jgi:hypothetical protein